MALVFIDSVGHWADGDLLKKWSGGNGSVQAGDSSRGGPAWRGNLNRNVPAVSGGVVGWRWRRNDGAIQVLSFYDGVANSDQVVITTNSDGSVNALRGGNPLGTSTFQIPYGTYVYFEVKTTISATVGTVEIRVNGVTILNLTGQNTKNTSNSTFTNIYVNYGNNSRGHDFYYCDLSGATNNNFLGDVRVDPIFPNGNGNSSVLVGSDANSTDNYLLVDETTPNGDTDYVESSNVGDKDTYAFGDISHNPAAIFGVQILPCAEKTDAGARSIATVTRSGGTDYDGTTIALGTSYTYYPQILETDPATAAAWTQSGVNSAEFGVKVAA